MIGQRSALLSSIGRFVRISGAICCCLLIISACTLPKVTTRKHDASSSSESQSSDAGERPSAMREETPVRSNDAGVRELDDAQRDASTGAAGRRGAAGMAPATEDLADAAPATSEEDAGPDQPLRVVDENELARWPMPDAFPGSQTPPSYETRGDTTIDLITHLEWQRSPPRVLEGCTFKYPDQSSSPEGDICTWEQAKDYCRRYGEQRNEPRWRMPTKIELESILDETRGTYTIDLDFFPNQEPYPYWTSTPYQDLEADYYFVEFLVGTTQHGKGAYKAEVRCVR